MLEPVVARYRDTVKRLYFRGDAAFANPEIYKFLEAEGMGYAIRLPANSIPQSKTDTCSSARLGDRRMSCAATSPASAIRRKVGRNPDGSWRRSSGTPMSVYSQVGFIVSNLRSQLSVSSRSTISAARRSNGSRKERARSNGHACRAAPSPPTPCVFSSMHSPTTWG